MYPEIPIAPNPELEKLVQAVCLCVVGKDAVNRERIDDGQVQG